MRTNLKVALRRMGLLDKNLPISQLEGIASRYWNGEQQKEGRRYNLFIVFRFIVFKDYKEETSIFLKDKEDRLSHSAIMDALAMYATNIAYASMNGEDHLELYETLSRETSKAALNISLEIAERYIHAREREYTQTLGGAIQRQLKQAGVH